MKIIRPKSFLQSPGLPSPRGMRLPFLAFALALACAACHKQPPPPAQPPHVADDDLRAFLDIHTVRAPFKLPDSAAGYYPVTLFFADGQEVARQKGPTLTGISKTERPFRGEVQMLWQTEDYKIIRASLVNGLNKTDLTEHFRSFWGRFGASTWRSCDANENLQYDGIRICGIYAANGPDSKLSPMLYGDGTKIPTFGKYVVAVGVIHGPDFDKLRDEFTKREPTPAK